MRNKKADLSWEYLIGILLGAFILILVGYSIFNSLSDGYSQKVNECSFFMKTIDGKPQYFTSGLDKVNLNFENTVSQLCPNKELEVKSESLVDVTNFVSSCYKQFGSGTDFFGANSYDNSICFSCGHLNIKDDFDNFSFRFYSEISKDKYKHLFDEDNELKSLNKVTLNSSSLPNNLVLGEKYLVYYLAYKVDENEFTNSLGSILGNLFGPVSYLMSSSDTDGFSGVVLQKTSGDFDTKRELSNCGQVIFPQN